MSSTSSVERRKHPRHPLATSVQFFHGASSRDFPGRCIDLSKGGMMMYAPATSPVRPGDSIRVTVGSVSRPEFTSLGERPIDATIVRVDRKALLHLGHIAVGLRFLNA